jgi:hypothetical protein
MRLVNVPLAIRSGDDLSELLEAVPRRPMPVVAVAEVT